MLLLSKHTFLLILLDTRKHSSADFNNAKDIFFRIQFVTIDVILVFLHLLRSSVKVALYRPSLFIFMFILTDFCSVSLTE